MKDFQVVLTFHFEDGLTWSAFLIFSGDSVVLGRPYPLSTATMLISASAKRKTYIAAENERQSSVKFCHIQIRSRGKRAALQDIVALSYQSQQDTDIIMSDCVEQLDAPIDTVEDENGREDGADDGDDDKMRAPSTEAIIL